MNHDSELKINSEDSVSDRASRRRSHTRAELLAAGRRVIAARGYHEANVADITAAADVGVGTFYLHFNDKDELLKVLVQEEMAGLRQQIAQTLLPGAGQPALPALLSVILRFAYEHREVFAILLAGSVPFAVGLNARTAIADALTVVLAAPANAAALAGYNIPLLARLVSGIVSQAILWWLESDTPEPEVMIEQVLRLLGDGLPGMLL